ncbi:MAG: VWA domain-containing protein [Candidatus Acidiferrales bacterium]
MNCTRKLPATMLVVVLAAAALSALRAQQPPAQDGHDSNPAPSLKSPTGRTPEPQPPEPRAQESPAPDARAKIRTAVSLVVVPVTVKNRDGELVSDLQQNDFRILEDGIEQPISLFSMDAFQLSVAVLIDDDLKRSTAEKVKKTLQAIAGGFYASDEVSLWRFDDVPEMVTDFIADNDELLAQLKRIDLDSSFPGIGSDTMTGGPVVNTQPLPGPLQVPAMAAGHPNNKHINDAIYAAAEQLADRAPDRRKIIFLISDGQNAKNNTHSYNDTLKLLLSKEISVYVIGVGEARLNRGITFLGNNIIGKYAHSTGGFIFYGSSREDIEGLYARVSEQARNQYTIGYSGAATDRSQPYHAIEVRVRRPGLSLLARDGYYLGEKP